MLVKEAPDVWVFCKKADKITVYTNDTWRKESEKGKNHYDKMYDILLSNVWHIPLIWGSD